MTVRASQNLVLYEIFVFVRTIHVFSSKGCYMPKFWVQNRTGCLWLLWAELPRNSFISVWHPHPVTVYSPSEIAVWALCSGGCFFKEKKSQTNKRTPYASFWPKCLEHSRRWSQPRDTASKEFRFGNLFPKVGKQSTKNQTSSYWRDGNIYFLRKHCLLN